MLPEHDVFAKHNFVSQWITHPIKRRLAKWYLNLLQGHTDIKVIGITGSAGKTTTKEMLASILKLNGKTVYSPKNIDSIYSIPNTILSTPPGTKYLILEMGVEYPGEMDFYLWLAKPDVGVITNIFPTHTEFLGSIEGVFKEKSKLVLGLSKNGKAVLNSSDSKLEKLAAKLIVKVKWFQADINPQKQNANAAVVVAKIFGVGIEKIKKGISSYEKPPHRLEVVKNGSGAFILDDSYNSNPWAALSTLEYFNSMIKNQKLAKGRKIAVLGDMLELGDYDETAHRELGREVAKSDFEIVIGVGNSSKFLIDEVNKKSPSTKTYLFDGAEEVYPVLRGFLDKDAAVLVKGSRSIGLDKVIDELR